MKTLFSALVFLVFANAGWTQGRLNFDTFAVDFKVMHSNGDPPGPGFKAQLFQVFSGGSLAPLPPSRPFYGNDLPLKARYYINPPDTAVHVPGSPPNAIVTIRFRAFNGVDYESSIIRAETRDFTLKLAGGSGVDPNLDPLAGQTLILVPEPSNKALGILATIAFLFRGVRNKVSLNRSRLPNPPLNCNC